MAQWLKAFATLAREPGFSSQHPRQAAYQSQVTPVPQGIQWPCSGTVIHVYTRLTHVNHTCAHTPKENL